MGTYHSNVTTIEQRKNYSAPISTTFGEGFDLAIDGDSVGTFIQDCGRGVCFGYAISARLTVFNGGPAGYRGR